MTRINTGYALIACAAAAMACQETSAPSGPHSAVHAAAFSRDGAGSVVVSGSGHLTVTGMDTGWRTFSIMARRHSDGTVDGRFQVQARQTSPNARLHGTVECVSVAGNQAWMVVRVTHSTSPNSPPGSFGRVTVVDNGEGDNGTPDQISLVGVGFRTHPPWCDTKPAVPLRNVEAGNIQVH